jgi:hypothetical protein
MITYRTPGQMFTLRGDQDRIDGTHNLYLILEDTTGPLVMVRSVQGGNVATVRRGRLIPVMDAVTWTPGDGSEQVERLP